MNILIFEIKKSLKSFYVWTISLVLTLVILMGGMYPIYLESKGDVSKVLEGFPPQFTQAFGFDLKTIFTFGGFYSFAFIYLAVIGAIMAVSISVSTFAREKRYKCTDFLLTKPVKREKIFIYKLLANIIILIGTNLVFIITAIVIYSFSKDTGITLGQFVLGVLSLLFTQLVFMALGILYAIFTKKVRTVSGIATAFGFGAFIIQAVVNIIEEDALNFISPFKYFEPQAIFFNNGFEFKYIITAIFVVVVCISISFFKYVKQDTNAV